MRVWVKGFGCAANLAEAEQLSAFVHQHAELVSDPKQADAIVIHSCGVKKATEFKLKRSIAGLRLQNPNAKILVSGCLPKINPSLLQHEQNLVQLDAKLEGVASALHLPAGSFSPSLSLPVSFSDSVISTMVIANGCLSNCSFCGTKKAKGVLKSFPVRDLEQRFVSDLQQGKKEFWLASQDNGCYGFDLNRNLPELVAALLDAGNGFDFRIRIGMLSPQYLDRFFDAFLELFRDKRVYRFVHLPLQSGSDRVLREMRRSYSVGQFEAWVKELRAKVPDLSLSTDIITGFPTETENEFEETLSAVERLAPDVVNISRFGLRPGTVAASLPQLNDREKTDRSHRLQRLCRNLFLEKNRLLVGTESPVMVSQRAKVDGWVARTLSYKPVVVPSAVLGESLVVRIEEAFPTFLKGARVPVSLPILA